jgi:hypothetical protein
MSDGRYYWRLDTADYVEHYGVGLLPEFLRAVDASGGRPVPITPEDVRRIDLQLTEQQS